MNLNLGKSAMAIMGPLLLLASGALLSAPYGSFKAPDAIAPFVPYLIVAPGVLLAWWFNHGRAMFMLLLVAVAHATLSAFLPGSPGPGINGQLIYAALCLLAPVNIVIFTFIPERATFSLHGLTRALFILIQIILIIAVTGASPTAHEMAANFLHFRIFDPAFDAWTFVTQPGILLYAIAGGALLARLIITRSSMDGGSLGVLVASALAFHMVGQGSAPTVFFTVAAMILILAVIQDAYRMAYIDELTCLPARRALTTALKNLSGTYCIAMLDVDFFKKFNDTYGHDAGDQVLQMVAAKLEAVNGGGKAFRYGGEEFTIIFANKNIDSAWQHLEAVRKNIAASRFSLRDKDRPETKPQKKKHKKKRATAVSVNISIGVAEKKSTALTPDDVMRAADQALYRAKNDGRNKVSR